MKTAIRNEETATVVHPRRDRRPFLRIEPLPAAALPKSASSAMPALEQAIEPHVPALVQLLVSHAFGEQSRRRARARPMAPTVSAVNRRKRAGRQWIAAILGGRVDRATLHAVGHHLIPVLAGKGPEVHHGEQLGLGCVEYLRGAVTARIFERPSESLVPHAKALHAFETVLAIHLAAYQHAVAQSRAAATTAP